MEKEVKLEKGMRRKGNSIEYRPYMEIDGEVIRRSFSGKTPKEVKKKRDQFLAGERTKREAKRLLNKTTPTVYKIGLEWITIYKSETISDGSHMNYMTYLENQIKGSNIDKPIAQVTNDDLQIFFNQRNWMSESALNYLLIIIRNCVKVSINKGYISDNPLDGVTVPKQPQKPVYAFEPKDSKRIHDFTFEHYFGLPIRVMLSIGCRPGELIALQWPIIHLDNRSINIIRTLSKTRYGYVIRETTKTGNIRDAYIHDAILDDFVVGKYLYESKVRQARKKKEPLPSPFVFSYKGSFMGYPTFQYHYRKFFEALNATLPEEEKIEYKSPNKCRTTFATSMLKCDGDIRTTQVALGHKNVKTTQRYTNPTFDDLKMAAAKLKY